MAAPTISIRAFIQYLPGKKLSTQEMPAGASCYALALKLFNFPGARIRFAETIFCCEQPGAKRILMIGVGIKDLDLKVLAPRLGQSARRDQRKCVTISSTVPSPATRPRSTHTALDESAPANST